MKILSYVLCLAFSLLLFGDSAIGQQPGKKRPVPTQRLQPGKSEQKKEPKIPAMPILPDIRNDPDFQAADVAIVANVTMEELRFDAVPNPTVDFIGKPKTATIWHTDRFNLPDQVQPGVTYRNVGIRLKITSRLADIDRIVAEALGEVPLNDENGQKESAPAARRISDGKAVNGRPAVQTLTRAPSESAPRNRSPK
jgi:hypothetical protein